MTYLRLVVIVIVIRLLSRAFTKRRDAAEVLAPWTLLFRKCGVVEGSCSEDEEEDDEDKCGASEEEGEKDRDKAGGRVPAWVSKCFTLAVEPRHDSDGDQGAHEKPANVRKVVKDGDNADGKRHRHDQHKLKQLQCWAVDMVPVHHQVDQKASDAPKDRARGPY